MFSLAIYWLKVRSFDKVLRVNKDPVSKISAALDCILGSSSGRRLAEGTMPESKGSF